MGKTEQESEYQSMYFKIVAASGGYRAHVYGANHELVWWTEVYVSRSGAENAINLLKNGASGALTY